MSLSKDYYDVLDPYLPEEARSLLNDQRVIIEEKIEKQIDGFAKKLQGNVETLVDEQVNIMKQDMEMALDNIQNLLADSSADPQKLQAAATQLKGAVEAQRQTIQGYGKKIRAAALTAARGVGLPIPLI